MTVVLLAIRERSRADVAVARAARRAARGRYPIRNTGRARVPASQPMPVREDLAELLREVAR
jgi:hypothetical protein